MIERYQKLLDPGESLTTHDRGQLIELQGVVDRLYEFTHDKYLSEFGFKHSATPENEIVGLCRDELKALQRKLFSHEDWVNELMERSICEFKDYYATCVQKKSQDAARIEQLKDYPQEWMNRFVLRFAFPCLKAYCSFDYQSLDFWNIDYDQADPEKFIPLPRFKELMDCLIVFDNFQRLWDFYHLSLENKEIIINQPKREMSTYHWQTNPDKELPELYNRMNGKFIASDTSLEQFTAIFSGLPTNSITPIKWHLDNASELLYFNEILQRPKQNKVNIVWNTYQRMTACFIRPDGKPFNASFKEIKQNLSINLSPNKQKAIDDLLTDL